MRASGHIIILLSKTRARILTKFETTTGNDDVLILDSDVLRRVGILEYATHVSMRRPRVYYKASLSTTALRGELTGVSTATREEEELQVRVVFPGPGSSLCNFSRDINSSSRWPQFVPNLLLSSSMISCHKEFIKIKSFVGMINISWISS